MTDPSNSLEQRVAALEARLERLEQVLKDFIEAMRRREAGASRAATAPPPRHVPEGPAAAAPAPGLRPTPTGGIARALEGKGPAWWLSRAGIGLVLFGVAFLFKYAVDQGWLTPQIRIAFGLALGALLVAVGFRTWRERRWFGAIAYGGATATFYITGFAAFQLFHLITYPVALGFMVAVTVYTMWAALHTDEPVLGVIGAVGGLGTPFLLYTAAGTVAGLSAYESLVLVAAAAIYLEKRWSSLLWTSVVGGWAVVLISLADLARGPVRSADQWGLQLAVIVAVAAFWAVPVMRTRSSVTSRAMYGVGALVLGTPVIAFYVANDIWSWGKPSGAIVAGVGALVWGAMWWRLRSEGRANDLVASMHGVGAAVLVAITLQHLFTNEGLIFVAAVEAAGLHLVAQRMGDRVVRLPAHGLALLVGTALALRLGSPAPPGPAVLTIPAALRLAAIVLGLVAANTLTERRESALYRIAVHLLFLGWLAHELARLPSGQAWVSAAWGVYGIVLLVAGLRLDHAGVRATALATFGLVVAKLFLVDLAALEAIWRVLLFLGFGAAFLALSYYFPSLWKAKSAADAPPR